MVSMRRCWWVALCFIVIIILSHDVAHGFTYSARCRGPLLLGSRVAGSRIARAGQVGDLRLFQSKRDGDFLHKTKHDENTEANKRPFGDACEKQTKLERSLEKASHSSSEDVMNTHDITKTKPTGGEMDALQEKFHNENAFAFGDTPGSAADAIVAGHDLPESASALGQKRGIIRNIISRRQRGLRAVTAAAGFLWRLVTLRRVVKLFSKRRKQLKERIARAEETTLASSQESVVGGGHDENGLYQIFAITAAFTGPMLRGLLVQFLETLKDEPRPETWSVNDRQGSEIVLDYQRAPCSLVVEVQDNTVSLSRSGVRPSMSFLFEESCVADQLLDELRYMATDQSTPSEKRPIRFDNAETIEKARAFLAFQ